MAWYDPRSWFQRTTAATAPPAEASLALAESPPLGRPEPAVHHPRWWGPRSVAGSTRSRGLTPERLASMLRQADTGDPLAQAELATEIEDKDLHICAEFGKRKLAVSQLQWQVVPASPRRRDQRIAVQATELLNNIPRLSAALFDAQDAVAKGYAGLEVDWRYRPGRLEVVRLLHRPAGWFRPDIHDPTVWTVADEHSALGAPLRPGQWIWHEARAKSGASPAGGALIRPIAWAFLFKTMGLRDLAVFLETYNAPLRLGRYAPGTSEDDRVALWTALKNLGVDAAAMLPEGVSVEFPVARERGTSADNYLGTARYWDAQISKAVLGQTLTTEAGSVGSQALGKVHDQVRRDIRDSDAAQLAETLTRDLLRPWAIWSFGELDAYPRLQFVTDNPDELAARAELYERLHKIGVRFPAAHIHATFGVPMPTDDEPVYGRGPEPAVGPVAPAAAAASEAGPRLALAEPGPDAPLPTEIERAIQAALRQGGYQGWEAILEQLRGWLGQAAQPGDAAALLLAALEQVDVGPMAEHLGEELLRADLIGRIQVRTGELPVGDWPAVPPSDAVEYWRRKAALTPEAWAELGRDHRARAFAASQFTTLQAAEAIQAELDKVLASGGTLEEFEAGYEDSLAAHGLGETEPHLVETVFRTNLHGAYGSGRYRTQTANLEERPHWRYEAVDDNNTRDTHRAMDGRVYPGDHPIWQTWYPPNGFNCRCYVRALTTAELAAIGAPISTAMPMHRVRRKDGQLGPMEPMTPDAGFTRNPALDPHEFDWGRFPSDWRRALRVQED